MKRGPDFGSDCGFDFRSLSALASHEAADDPTQRIINRSHT